MECCNPEHNAEQISPADVFCEDQCVSCENEMDRDFAAIYISDLDKEMMRRIPTAKLVSCFPEVLSGHFREARCSDFEPMNVMPASGILYYLII
ncbi:hypothetical protein AVEN_79464-1 [Araneus ventricosus]|uniref:Uncharacterized protein n=1 Tax=Araneus ventricosus TaxID=182803 RepID=A0A4Y2FLX0_ARAVE|nr:hypothetical protein AVEN_79464-1 [Araneus ventricosus]